MTDLEIDRRSALLGGGLMTAATLAGLPISADAATKAVIDTQDPRAMMSILARLQGDLSGRLSYGYQRGRVYGLVAGQGLALGDYGRRLYDYESGSVGRSRLLPNGDVETRSRTSLFYIDSASGAYLKSWRNPITGDEIEVPPLRRGVAGGTLTPTGPSVNANDALESSVFGSPAALEFKTIGERTWVSRHAFTRWTPTGGTRARSEMTLDTWIVATRDLRDTRLTTIPATSSWTSQTEWQTWLQMPEGQPGQQLWRSDGVKVSEVSALPASFVAQCRTRHRGMLSDPIVFD